MRYDIEITVQDAAIKYRTSSMVVTRIANTDRYIITKNNDPTSFMSLTEDEMRDLSFIIEVESA